MTNILFIQLQAGQHSSENALIDWGLYDEMHQKTAGGAGDKLKTVQQYAESDDTQIAIIAPANDVLQTYVSVPAGQKRHLQRALPFLIEEHIATPIEDMHLCTGPISHGKSPVIAVSHETIQHWLSTLKSNQIEPDWLLDEGASLGVAHELEILVDSGCINIYCQHQPFLSCEPCNVTLVADCLIAGFKSNQLPASGQLTLCENLSDEDHSSAEALATQFQVEGIELKRQTTQNKFDYQCQQLLTRLQQSSPGTLVNLLDGPYRSTSHYQRKRTPNWKALAATLVICVGLKLLFDIGTGLYLNYQSTQVDKQTTALYRELFPQDKRIVNIRVQMQNHLNNRNTTSESEFMLLFGHIANAIKKQNSRSATEIQQLRYNDKSQTLLVDLQVRDVQQLERLKQAVEERNINADILSANEEQQWIKGRIKLSL